MHRFIMNTPKGMDTDHINGDKLDNRRSNLREGVYLDKRRNRWEVSINAFCKKIYIGTFTDKKEAAFAYNEAAKKYHGEFARLNEI